MELEQHRPEHDRWMTDERDRDYLPPLERYCRRCGRPDLEHAHRRYRLTVELGFGLPTIARHELAPTSAIARALYEQRATGGRVVLVEELGRVSSSPIDPERVRQPVAA